MFLSELKDTIYLIFRTIVSFLKDTRYLLLYALISFIVLFPENLKIYGLIKSFITFVVVISIKSFITVVVVIVYFFIYRKNKPHYSFKDFALASFEGVGFFPVSASLASLSLFAIYTSWISDFLKEGNLCDSVITLVYLFFLPVAFLLSIPENKKNKNILNKPEPKKVLIFPLSKPSSQKDILNSIEELKQEIRNKNILQSSHNWAQIFLYLENHINTVERIVILISKQSEEYFEKFEELLLEFEKAYKGKISENFKEKLRKTKPLDFNNFEDIEDELLCNFKEIKREGYKDKDISVFISPGTSLVTLTLTLFAIKEGRQVEYTIQTESKREIISVNVSIADLYNFYPELKLNKNY